VESSLEPTRHPLLAGVEAIEAALDEMVSADPLYLSAPEKRALLVDVARLESRLTSVRLRAMAVADDAAEAEVRATRLPC
jgi:hypothetical protein